MSEPVPVRGYALVKDIERILRPQSGAGDFRYSTSTRPTIQEVCDEIDWAYDELVIELDTFGIKFPPTNDKTKRWIRILNAYLAAANIEDATHTATEPNTTTYGTSLREAYEKKKTMFMKEARVPVEDRTMERPIIDYNDAMYSTLAELYDPSTFDTKPRSAFFRVDKEY